jgi:hypothetical protein
VCACAWSGSAACAWCCGPLFKFLCPFLSFLRLLSPFLARAIASFRAFAVSHVYLPLVARPPCLHLCLCVLSFRVRGIRWRWWCAGAAAWVPQP